ncbi:ribose transport system substrate-binding protein [Lachnospiraceae bacterium PF1-22]|uniref:LacI family DNA-binding transcriptional regulator n=1 Tax=Ohessyouella blattaphilus TaxID=2949333 RepID=UPI003E31FF9C
MKTTIKDIAKIAGVSVATVSHVINKTRYVSPELISKVEEAIYSTDYKEKYELKKKNMRVGKASEIAIVLPFTSGAVYSKLMHQLSQYVLERDYLPCIYLTNDDYDTEKAILKRIASNKNIVGIIFSPCRRDIEYYREFWSLTKPVVLVERSINNCDLDSYVVDSALGIYKCTRRLLKSGHEKIGLLASEHYTSVTFECKEGYRKAIEGFGLTYQEQYILNIENRIEEEAAIEAIRKFYNQMQPTGIVCCGNHLTFLCLKAIQSLGLECPQDISIIGFGDDAWSELLSPSLTVLSQNTEEIAYRACNMLLNRLSGMDSNVEKVKIPLEFVNRKSTQMIGRGPFGERACSPDELVLTNSDKEQLRKNAYKVGISFHYSGPAWKRLHEAGIRQTLEALGITVATVTEANFDSALQVTQLEGLAMQQLDAIIAIPTDDNVTSEIFRKLSRETKLVFLSNVPKGLSRDEYISCVSVNERENGRSAALLMGEYFKGQGETKVGFINHGANFYGTHLRDGVAMQTILENYANIDVASIMNFQNIDEGYEICKKMLGEHPDIKGLYVSWDRPTLSVIEALKELGREDIAIFTTDLDIEIGSLMMKRQWVKGLSTQRPYEQGVAAALATAKALLGYQEYKYIGVPPLTIQRETLVRGWKDIMREPLPGMWKEYTSK